MPINMLQEENRTLPVIGSARDIGNFSAGFVGGRGGQSWINTRLMFDAVETQKSKKLVDYARAVLGIILPPILKTEGSTSQYAQKLGHGIGWKAFWNDVKQTNMNNFPWLNLEQSDIMNNSIIKRDDYTP